MGTFVQGVTGAIIVATIISAGCGGGAATIVQQVQLQAADLSVVMSSSSVTILQGGVSAPVNFSIVPRNGFSGSVQASFIGLPAGVSSNPVSPFTITSGSEAAVNFGADATASTGSFTLSAQAVGGALSHSASLTLAIQASSAAAFPRSNFVRTDSTPLADNPIGEVHHRHIAYDPAHQYVFIANAAMNRLEVISAVDESRVGRIAIPGVTSADLSVDGATIFAGTGLNGIVAVDTTALQVKARYQQAGLSPIPATVFDRPAEVISLSTGKCFVRLRQASSPQALLALWDPASGSASDLTPAASALFQNGSGPMGRSGDHTAVIVAANDSSGNVAIFAGNGAARAGPQSIGPGSISWLAANSDGSRLAVVLASSGATKLVLLDGIKLGIGGKPAMATLVDMNTLSVVSPAVTAGPQQLTLTNANGEAVSWDAAVIAN